jgi:signal transduction histidine kinase
MLAILEPSSHNISQMNIEQLADLVESNFDSVQTIIACAIHQKRIVDDILTLSKLDSRLLLITPVRVQANTLIQDTLKMSRAEAQVSDIRIRFEKHPSIRDLGIDWVMMDPSRVLQIFINLLTNSIKFTRTEPRREIVISIRAARENPPDSDGYLPAKMTSEDLTLRSEWGTGDIIYLQFMISDTGKGLSAGSLSKLFQRFSQATPRTHIDVC